MKSTIKSIVILSMFAFILTFVMSADTFAQGRGKGMKTGTGQKWVDANGDGICDNFVDANGDGINDNPQGYRAGSGTGVKGKGQGVGRFGAKSGVCDGTAKGRRGLGTGNTTGTTPKVNK